MVARWSTRARTNRISSLGQESLHTSASAVKSFEAYYHDVRRVFSRGTMERYPCTVTWIVR